jgi:hypothetical protein
MKTHLHNEWLQTVFLLNKTKLFAKNWAICSKTTG